MRSAITATVRGVTVLVLMGGLAVRTDAGPLDPNGFPLTGGTGMFPTAAGTYTFNTSGTPTLSGPGGTNLTGTVANGVAVFDFTAITIGSAQTFTGTGALPLALLSRGDVTIDGMIDVSGGSPILISIFPTVNATVPGPGGPGGGSGGQGLNSGPGIGGPGGPGAGPGGGGGGSLFGGGGGGGGFGGAGGNGFLTGPPGTPAAPGGVSYGNLALSLQGGSGGGANGSKGGVSGGGGGGGIEVGALGGIIVGGGILANGGSGSLGAGPAAAGGSGGGIFLHGDAVALSGVLSATGGSGGFGGGGGGGRVLIQVGPGGFTNLGRIDVSGGPVISFMGQSGQPGGVGVITISVVPGPPSLVLLGTGLLGALGAWRLRREGSRAADGG